MADTIAAGIAEVDPQRINGKREGWVCIDCDPYEEPDGPPIAEYLVGPGTDRRPVCRWHRDEAVHDAIPYGLNCPDCGVQHSALWPEWGPGDGPLTRHEWGF